MASENQTCPAVGREIRRLAPFGRAPAGSGSCTVAGCRPPRSQQVPTGAGAAEPEKRASPAPVVSVREERRREKKTIHINSNESVGSRSVPKRPE